MTRAESLNNQANSLYIQGHRHTALAHIKAALAQEPKNPLFQCNLAVMLTNFGQYAEASRLLKELVTLNPSSFMAWHAYGVLCLVSGRPKDAEDCFDICIKIRPDYGAFQFDKACAALQAGDWLRGFELYESRKKWKPERVFEQVPEWQGQPNKKIYVWAEQGIGDTIQFSRYLPWLQSISEKVTFAIPPSLLSLFQYLPSEIEVVPINEALVEADYHVPLMSLANYFMKSGYADNPFYRSLGYFSADQLQRPSSTVSNIGLCWACNATSANYRERSVPLREFLALTNISAEFFSLQIGEAAGDIAKERAQMLITDLSGDIGDDWQKTANYISTMDYIVSTDTALAHLAASMGKPTIMFLARRDNWRWGNEGEKTPWYPTMTILRADKPFDWSGPVQKARTILEAHFNVRHSMAA